MFLFATLFIFSFKTMLPTNQKQAQRAENQTETLQLQGIEVADEETGEITIVYISGNDLDGQPLPAIFDPKMWEDTGNILNIFPFKYRPAFVGWCLGTALDEDGKDLLRLKQTNKPYPCWQVQELNTNSKYLIPKWKSVQSLENYGDDDLLFLNYEGIYGGEKKERNAEGEKARPTFHSVRIRKFKGNAIRPGSIKDEKPKPALKSKKK